MKQKWNAVESIAFMTVLGILGTWFMLLGYIVGSACEENSNLKKQIEEK